MPWTLCSLFVTRTHQVSKFLGIGPKEIRFIRPSGNPGEKPKGLRSSPPPARRRWMTAIGQERTSSPHPLSPLWMTSAPSLLLAPLLRHPKLLPMHAYIAHGLATWCGNSFIPRQDPKCSGIAKSSTRSATQRGTTVYFQLARASGTDLRTFSFYFFAVESPRRAGCLVGSSCCRSGAGDERDGAGPQPRLPPSGQKKKKPDPPRRAQNE